MLKGHTKLSIEDLADTPAGQVNDMIEAMIAWFYKHAPPATAIAICAVSADLEQPMKPRVIGRLTTPEDVPYPKEAIVYMMAETLSFSLAEDQVEPQITDEPEGEA